MQNSMREYASAKKLQDAIDFVKQKVAVGAGAAGAYGLYRELKDILE